MDELTNKHDEYIYVRLNESHYKDLCYISKSAFNIDPGVKYYQDKNRTSKFGDQNLGYIAYSNNGEPAAFYGVYSCLVEFNGKIYKAVQSGDTMTHKNHTGKGLFTALAKMTYALAKNSGAEIVFGSPNYNSLPGFIRKLNWNCPYKFHDFRIHTFTLPLAKVVKKFPFLNTIYKLYARFVMQFYISNRKEFRNSVLENNVLGVHRNEDFYFYKSLSGSRVVSINGIDTWIKTDGFLMIGDINIQTNFNFKEYIKKLKRFCFWMGASEAMFITSPDTKLDKMFSENFKPKEGLPLGGADLGSELNSSEIKLVFGDLDTF